MNQKNFKNKFLKILRYAIVITIAIFCIRFIPNFLVRGKQLATWVNMKSSSAYIDEYIEKKGAIEKGEEEKLFNELSYKIDEWNNKLILLCKWDNGNFHYVLISKGSNGKLDLENMNDYFILPSIAIHDMPAHDIVIRDGNYITDAGKFRPRWPKK